MKKPTDLDLHCLQRQDISGFSRVKQELDGLLHHLDNKNKKKTLNIYGYKICIDPEEARQMAKNSGETELAIRLNGKKVEIINTLHAG